MTPNDPIDILLLERYFAGRSTPAERDRLLAWLAVDPARAGEVESYRRLWTELGTLRPDSDAPRAAWLELAGRIARSDRTERPAHVERWTIRQRSMTVRVTLAAAVVIALGLVATRHRRFEQSGGLRVAARRYEAGPRQRMVVTLSDGTQFTLAPVSTLDVPLDYAAGNRSVVLDGEAFFTVAHDTAHPFAVRAGNAVATDVGTAFDVRAYASDHGVRVAVTEGRVALGLVARKRAGASPPRPAPAQMLARGDVAVFTDTAIAVTHEGDVAAQTAWTEGTLTFSDARLGDVIADLDRWYDLDIRVEDPVLRNRRIASRFENAPIDQVLGSLAVITGARYERRGRTVVFVAALGSSRSH